MFSKIDYITTKNSFMYSLLYTRARYELCETVEQMRYINDKRDNHSSKERIGEIVIRNTNNREISGKNRCEYLC